MNAPHSVDIQFGDGRCYEADHLSTDDIRLAGSPFDQTVLQFAMDWYQGKSLFELKTSGSTGLPKVIQVKRWQLEASARMTAAAFGLQRGMSALLCLDPQFVAGTLMMVRCFTVGMKLIAVPPEANPLGRIPDACALDFAAFVPYQIEKALEHSKERLVQIRCILVGGAAIPAPIESRIRELPHPAFATYGMTETLTHVAIRRINGAESTDVFTPLPGVTCALDGRGCLVITAPHLDGAVVTNDCAKLLPDGRFTLEGRVDFVINSGGVKVHPESTEPLVMQVLHEQGLLGRFYLTGVPDRTFGEKVAMVIEGEPIEPARQEQLLQLLQARLPAYHGPRKIYFMRQFEETTTGKVIRKRP
ncbi:MAG: AMP-binding protein [Cyclobacteriaceae bacterium]